LSCDRATSSTNRPRRWNNSSRGRRRASEGSGPHSTVTDFARFRG
jgi:hypothetical protein